MDLATGSMLTKSQRIILGLIVLILVDVIWVSSSELTKYIYKNETFQKPFFCTYVKTSMFTFYLFGFLLWPPWKDHYCSRPSNYIYLESSEPEDDVSFEEPMNTHLSNPIYVPVKIHNETVDNKSSGTESDDSSIRSVRFHTVAEVRQLSEAEANDALLARLSYQASIRATEVVKRAAIKLPVYQVSKVAFVFCLLWFAANYSYQVALLKTEAGIVNILSSTSSLFTFFLAAVYPSSQVDKFTISKLFAVILSIVGIILVSTSDLKFESELPLGVVLSLLSAFFYATYLVFLKRTVKNEDNIDIPMFFGFVGLFNLLLLWPIFFFLHFSKLESFEWPTREQMVLLFLNGLMGTVISEALWLWGCFLTSSLMATIAISMTIPMTMMADVILKNVNYSYLFYFGTIPMVLSFFMVTVYSHFENWDPIFNLLHCAYSRICYKTVTFQRRSIIHIMNNSQPKIVYNEECIDLRNHCESDMICTPNKNLSQNPYQKEWSSQPKTKHERNEVVNTALKKLAKSYNTNNTPYYEKKVKTKVRENSLYDPYRKKFSDAQDGNSLKSKSDLTSASKKDSKNKIVCPSSPIIPSTYEKREHPKKAEPFKNKFTMTKFKPGIKGDFYKEGKNLKRDTSIDKLINKLLLAEQIPPAVQIGNDPVWKDQRLSDKYSLLKLPWKNHRSHTLPVFSQPSIVLKEQYLKRIMDNSDKKTYLYDDGSEIDSLYLEPKRHQNFGFTLQTQLLMILNISAYICAFLVISLIVWFISGNKFFHKLLIPEPPEHPFKKYAKYIGGSIVYTLTSILRFIGSIFAIPTQQVYHPATEYAWPPVVHYN